jgi:N-acetylglucosamine-6-sulfatase
MRRTAVLVAAAVLLIPTGGISAQDGGQGPRRPNVVVIMTDDQRLDDMVTLRQTRRFIGHAGVTFNRYYASYPVCCPARATYLTGQYAQNHGVRCLYRACGGGYTKLDQSNYLPVWLRDAGYVTAHIGKFLNGYGKERSPDVPRGWSEWYGLVDHSTYRMWGYKIHEKGPGDEDGRTQQYGRLLSRQPKRYQTDVLTKKAVDFIKRRAPDADPFFLSLGYLAPHHESGHTQQLTGQLVRAAPKYRGRFAGRSMPKKRNFNEDVSDKPWFVGRWNHPITADRERKIEKRWRERSESLLSVDDGVHAIIRALGDVGELDNTYVLFTSDHGFMQGEHRIPQGKMVPYDPSTHVPFLIRGPGVARGRDTGALVGDVDLAPTILDIANAPSPSPRRDGLSVLKYARNPSLSNPRPYLHTTAGQGAKGRTNTREGGTRGTQPRVPAWSAVRTTRWVYVEYKGGQRELFYTKGDPLEMNSRIRDPNVRTLRNTLRRTLSDLRRCRGRSCDKFASVSVR